MSKTGPTSFLPPVTLLWDCRTRGAEVQENNENAPAASTQAAVEESRTIVLGELDVLQCTDEELELHLSGFRELMQNRPELWIRKKGGKGYSERRLALIQAELAHYQSILRQAIEVLKWLLGRLAERIAAVRCRESMLLEYYETLDFGDWSDECYDVHKRGIYHQMQREAKRRLPHERYSKELDYLLSRHGQIKQVLEAVEGEERAYRMNYADEDGTDANKTLNPEDTKIEEMYKDAAGADGGNAITFIRMRALQPLIRKEQELRATPPLLASDVHSRLRKELILPFSVRVLSLKVKKGNIMDDKFVQWYINTVIDPLTMAQLVELVPREHLVTTTVRLARVCDAYQHARRAQPLPDISHVVLEAISEGRAESFASLVLSGSATCTRALRDKDEEATILFSALILGQVETMRRIMSVGFYNVNALVVWLFLNPDLTCKFYTSYVNKTAKDVKKYLDRVSGSATGMLQEKTAEEDIIEMAHLSLAHKYEEWDSMLLTSGVCASLRSFLNNRLLWKKSIAASECRPSSGQSINLGNTREKTLVDCNPGVSFSTKILDEVPVGETSFSSLLSRRKFDHLFMSTPKCAVLPAINTSAMRRVDPWGYTPLQATKAHLLLVGDTSTTNAHVVRLPARRMTKWNEHTPNEPPSVRNKREQIQTAMDLHSTRFYYEVHISLFFLVNDVPLSPTPFSDTSFTSGTCELPPLQHSNAVAGWCSDECASAADGHSLCEPLGNDASSVGISFDVVHRYRIDECHEEIILRPMKRAVGCITPFGAVGEAAKPRECLLLRLHVDRPTDTPTSDVKKDSDSDILSLEESATSLLSEASVSQSVLMTPCMEASLGKTMQERETRVPPLEVIGSQHREGVVSDTSNGDPASRLSYPPIVLSGLSVYKSRSLVVGCLLDLTSRCTSFTVNGVNIGQVFAIPTSSAGFRPAVSLQESEKMKTVLHDVTSSESTVVRFAFEQKFMVRYNAELGLQSQQGSVERDGSTDMSNRDEECKPDDIEPIPGSSTSAEPLLFDSIMMQCAVVRLLTGAERGIRDGSPVEDVELMKAGKEGMSLGTTATIKTSSIRGLLNNPAPGEKLLFFPPLLTKSRSDELEQAGSTEIIPEDARLTPLCTALTMRCRVAAYQIAIHPLLDLDTATPAAVRQRRKAVLAAATLGYEEVLYVLFQRLHVHEVVAMFSIKASSDPRESSGKTSKRFRFISLNGINKVTSATTSQCAEYTPLHCALLEGHRNCAHLILFYLNRALSKEYLRYAVNVFSRGGETALVIACRLGYTDIAKRLLALGASPFLSDRVTRSNCLELACAGQSEEIALTLLNTPDFHSPVAVNQAGAAPPLCWCALNNISSLVKPLLENGADPNITLDGPTPLLLAVMFGSQEVALELLRYCDSSADQKVLAASTKRTSMRKRSNMMLSPIIQPTEVIVEPFLSVIDVDAVDPRTNSTALHLACEHGQLAVVRALIASGAGLNVQKKVTYSTPLHLAIECCHEKLALQIIEYAKNKLRRGHNVLDINAIDREGNTVLHSAAFMGMLPVIEYIMSQFSDEEVTRLHSIHEFAKRPSPVNVLAVNRRGRTPLLVAIGAHQEEAVQLIASLTPDYLANPGGVVVGGVCAAVTACDAEGLDNATLFLLSSPNYTATEAFRAAFLKRYNAKRMVMDTNEDGDDNNNNSTSSGRLRASLGGNKRTHKRRGRRSHSVSFPHTPRWSPWLNKLCNKRKATGSESLNSTQTDPYPQQRASGSLARSKSMRVANKQCNLLLRMLLAKGCRNPTMLKTIQFLRHGFVIEELYAMLDVISSESSRKVPSHRAMHYTDVITSYLHLFGGVHVAPTDAVSFTKKLFFSQELMDAVDKDKLEESKRKLLDTRALCRDFLYIIRSRGTNADGIDDMRQMVAQSRLSGAALRDELTSPFGFTALQLAATLSLPNVCSFLLNECYMDPLFVPRDSPVESATRNTNKQQADNGGTSAMKWFLSPFRLAVRTHKVQLLTEFLTCKQLPVSVQEMLDHVELPEADPLQRTALQELLYATADLQSQEDEDNTIAVIRLLLQHGATVRGNFDALGKDAWMLAVSGTPGKGTALQVFLEEQVELDEEEFGSTSEETAVEPTSSTEEQQMESEKDGKEVDAWGSADASAMSLSANIAVAASQKGDCQGSCDVLPSFGYPRRHVCDFRGAKQSEYCAALIFSCAENNPRLLAKFLRMYSHVLSKHATHPETGETLIVYLLRRAADLYLEECGLDDLFQWDARPDDMTVPKSSHSAASSDARTHSSAESNATPYRDPLTVPSVKVLLAVVEQLLRTFSFDNLYREYGGQSALLLAARLSCNPLVRHIVTQRDRQGGLDSRPESPVTFGFTNVCSDNLSPTRGNAGTAGSDPPVQELQRNLSSFNCWMSLCNCMYYAEEDQEALFTIIRSLPNAIRVPFLELVYPNLHPMVALSVTASFSTVVKHILTKPMVSNTFWCSVFYARFVGRLEEVDLKRGKWSELLSLLLPSASPVPIYLLKTLPSFPFALPGCIAHETFQRPQAADNSVCASYKNADAQPSPNWKCIVNVTEQYVKQLAAAAVCAAAPNHLVVNTTSYKNLPSLQRSVLLVMASHFHELLELAVRFDNCSLFKELVDAFPSELQHCLKHEWHCLMETIHFQLIAVAAGSVNTLKFLSGIPEAAKYVTYDRYDRIDADTGVPENFHANDPNLLQETHHSQRRKMPPASNGLVTPGEKDRHASTLNNSNVSGKQSDSSPSEKSKKEGSHQKVRKGSMEMSCSYEVLGFSKEDSLQSLDITAALRMRAAVGAVTWGIGAAARPIPMHKGPFVKEKASPSKMKSVWGKAHAGHTTRHSPSATKAATSVTLSSSTKQKLPPLGGGGGGGNISSLFASHSSRGGKSGPTTFVEAREPRFFAYYLCDWALHTELLLHAPYPSVKMIDTLLYLMDNRAPLSASVVHLFLAASRPMNRWLSGSGEHITLNYVTHTHGDTILHLLVQNHQIQLTRYFLAAAHCYFACYQYDPPSTVPPRFPVSNIKRNTEGAADGSVNDGASELYSRYPAVFLRSMLRTNKHGLTAFDYARGTMISVLQEYGCVPPPYRPNPQGFSSAIRIADDRSTFQKVPQLLLVSHDFVKLRDNNQPISENVGKTVKSISDATIQRNQATTLRSARAHMLTNILADDVSLLHIGLCSADDELVLENIERRRKERMRPHYSAVSPRFGACAPSSVTLQKINVAQKPVRLPQLRDSVSNAARSGTPASRRKAEKVMQSVMKLIDALQRRGLVVFPLLLPTSVSEAHMSAERSEEGLALQLAMTPMAVAIQAGAVKVDAAAATAPSQQQHGEDKQGSLDSLVSTSVQETKNPQYQLQPYIVHEREAPKQHPARALELWMSSLKTSKGTQSKNKQELHQNTQAIIKAMEKGGVYRSARQNGLTISVPYELKMDEPIEY